MSEKNNEVVADFLRRRGFNPDPDLAFLGDGLKPDLWCDGPTAMWVEVKSPADPLDEPVPLHIWDYLTDNLDDSLGNWTAIAHIAENCHQKDAKAAVALLRGLSSLPGLERTKEIFAVVPTDPDFSARVHFAATGETGSVLFYCVRSESGIYGYPYSFEPEPYFQEVRIGMADTYDNPVPLHRITADSQFRLAIRLTPGHGKFHLMAIGREPAVQISTRDQIRKSIRVASKQLKTALEHRQAPAIVFVVMSGITFEESSVLAAAFGDLAWVFPLNDSNAGRWQFGLNGRFTAGRHTSISALVCSAAFGTPVTIHNPAAVRPLPRGLFGGSEFWLDASGKLDGHRPDNADDPNAMLQLQTH